MALTIQKPTLFQMARNGQDDEAIVILCDVAKDFYGSSHSAEGLGDITRTVAPLRGNLGIVPVELKEQFARAADRQDARLAASPRIVTSTHTHHFDIKQTETGQWVSTNKAMVMASDADDLAYALMNPWDLNESLEDNLKFLADAGRMTSQFGIVSKEMGIRVVQLSLALDGLLHTAAAKRFYSINKDGKIDPGQAPPEAYLALIPINAKIGGFDI